MDWPIALTTMCMVLVGGVVTCVLLITSAAGKSKDNSGIDED